MKENSIYDKKSLMIIEGKTSDYYEIAKDAVAFSNAQGGILEFGIEDDSEMPIAEQRIDKSLLTRLENRVKELTSGVMAKAEKKVYENGGETITLSIYRNPNIVATTADGKIYLRSGDNSIPISGENLPRLLEEKNGFSWEIQNSPFSWKDADQHKLSGLLASLRRSNRLSDFLKDKDDKELLTHFFLVDEESEKLTNLGVIFIGTQQQRGRIPNAPAVQCIKYDEYGEKVNKWIWTDFTLAPHEIIEAIWNQVPEWKESQEVSDGLFRINIPAYDRDIIRELLCNALVHRTYTIKGDIFINIHPDHLEVVNPGLLPLGVTPQNILHKSRKRNEHLAALMYVLHYMEREGSGYDKIYEILLQQGKQLPEVKEGDDYVSVSVERRIRKSEIVSLMKYVNEHFTVKLKQNICMGLVAQHESLSARELEKLLELDNSNDLQPWLQPLVKQNLIVTVSVRSKGKEYRVNPDLLSKSNYKGRTSLKRIEDYRLKELIIQDLKVYKQAKLSEIHERIGVEISEKRIRLQLRELIAEEKVKKVGTVRWTTYILSD